MLRASWPLVAQVSSSQQTPAMNTISATTPHTLQISSPIRVTGEAVELRDRAYPIHEIESAQVVEVVPSQTTWNNRIVGTAIYTLVFATRSFVEQRPWASNGLAGIVAWFLPVVAVILIIATCVWIWYRVSRKNWQHMYVASLDMTLGKTAIAASYDQRDVENIVAEVSRALAQAHSKPQPSLDAPADLRGDVNTDLPNVLYSNENSIYIDSNHLTVEGSYSLPVSRLRFTRISQAEPKSPTKLASSIQSVILGGITVAIMSLVIASDKSHYAGWILGIICLFVLARFLFIFLRRDKARPQFEPLTTIYICTFTTDINNPGLVSVDKGYIDRFAVSVNAAVREQNVQHSRRSKVPA